MRTAGPTDDTRAYVVMPYFETFEAYARRVEAEMPKALQDAEGSPEKALPCCHAENELCATTCHSCEYQFPAGGRTEYKSCPECATLNPRSATSCQSCGASFSSFVLTLDEALRTGAIVRGMDLQEEEVKLGEEMAGPVRERILATGDAQLVRILKNPP